MSVGVPHIYDELTGIQEYTIHLRQAISSELPFVSITEEDGQSIVNIETEGIPSGDYELKLESYDAKSSSELGESTLKTDTILVSVMQSQTI